jgi:enoyl-CoA hydratase/carnithine racemase
VGGTVHVEQINEAIVLLEIDNPPANALGAEMREVFIAPLDHGRGQQSRALPDRHRPGRAFCSGDDLKSDGPQQDDLAGFGRVLDRLEATGFP